MDPHITVLAPGRPTLPPDVTSTAFAGLELNMAPFRVSAHRLHRFSRHRRHTIVLLPEDSTNLTKLFNAVVECCNWQETVTSTRRPYQPHVTLINQVSDQQLELFEQQLSSLQPLIEFDCYQLSLYAKQASWPAWQEIQRLSLDPATRRTAS